MMVIVRTRHCRRCDCHRLCPDEIGVHGPLTCHACGDKHKAQQVAAWRQAHLDRCREAQRRYLQRHPEANAEITRRYQERLKRDPVKWQRYLEACRMNYRLRRERAGAPVLPLTAEKYEGRYGSAAGDGGDANIDGGPLVRAIREWLDDDRVEALANQSYLGLHTITKLGDLSGVTVRTIRRWLAAENPRCALTPADRVAIAIGTHLDVLYADGPGVRDGR